MAPDGSHDDFSFVCVSHSSHVEFSLIFIPFLVLCDLFVIC